MTDHDSTCETWAIVLAAGQGQRLARLVRALHGHDADCGTPERLLECLESSGGLEGFLGRLAATGFRMQPSG